MWRRSFEEDWERRKTYLIRSLFQDIPILSPVPEEQESRAGAISPSDVPPPRPHSPLPPLIIERIVPYRHDHPEQFYRDLEKKMKKLYRKLFHNEENNSIDDLIDTYGEDFETRSLVYELADYQTRQGDAVNIDKSISAEIMPSVNFDQSVTKSRNLSYSESFSVQSEDQNDDGDDDADEILLESGKSRSSETSLQTDSFQSSTQSQSATQVTTVVDVHQEASNDQNQIAELAEHSTDDDETHVLSPVFVTRRIAPYGEFEAENRRELASTGKASDSSRDGHTSEVDRGNKEKEEEEETSTHNTTENQSLVNDLSIPSDNCIEVMRRRREVSLSLGSLPGDTIIFPTENSSGFSLTYTDVDFQQKMSHETKGSDESNKSETDNERESLSRNTSNEFNSMLASTTSTNYEDTQARFLSEIRRRKNAIFVEESLLETKRKKYEDAAIQTSTSNAHESSNSWNQLKCNFFVGVPKIYKLCACSDHFCKERS